MTADDMNARVQRAEVALRAYIEIYGFDDECKLTDLLTDLRHWADQEKQDFDHAVATSQYQFYEEKLNEDGDPQMPRCSGCGCKIAEGETLCGKCACEFNRADF